MDWKHIIWSLATLLEIMMTAPGSGYSLFTLFFSVNDAFFALLMQALGRLHDAGWLHGDLRSPNVLVEEDTGKV